MQAVVVLTLAISCLSAALCRAEICPPKCTCVKVNGKLNIECEIAEPTELKKTLKKMSKKKLNVHKLYIDSDNSLSLGPKILGNMTVDKVYVNSMNLAAISSDVYAGQEENLFKVGFDNAQMSSIPVMVIANLVRLEQFEFRFTRSIKVIEECAFCVLQNPECLQRLDLRGNNIEVIDKDAFVTLIRLKWLRLWDNNLRHIPYSILPPNSGHLTYVDLEANEMTHVPHHLIAPLPYMAYISMNHNMVRHLPFKSIDEIVKRNITVKLYHNQVECHCGFRQIAARNQRGHLWHGKDDTCSKPYRLANKRIKDLVVSDFSDCK